MIITACSDLLDTVAIVNIWNKRKNKISKYYKIDPKHPKISKAEGGSTIIKSFIQNIKRKFQVSQGMEEYTQNRCKNTAKCPQLRDTYCEGFISILTVRVMQETSLRNFIR